MTDKAGAASQATTGGAASGANDWVAWAFLAIAAVCCVGAFVGLDASSYWIDELFSLYVMDHRGGLGEVLARALTDTHPPLYYFVMYEWIGLFGSSEVAVRAFSAICCVASLAILFFGLKGVLSLPARAFGVAVGATSKLFFEQAQTARNYGLSLPIAAGILVLTLGIQRRLKAGAAAPMGLMAGFCALGFVGAFTHFYVLLASGAAHLFLLLSARSWRDRIVVVVSGLIIVVPIAIYAVVLTGASQQDLHNMWFSNKTSVLVKQALGGVTLSWSHSVIAAIVVLLLAPWADRMRRAAGKAAAAPPAAPMEPLALCGLVILGVYIAGLMVSFTVAPSFGKRNLMVLGPFFWVIAAWLYEAIRPDPRGWAGRATLAVVLIGLVGNTMALTKRLAPWTEEWRGSAAYVAKAPGCEGQPIPAVLPFVFGPSTPFFRDLARERFFGRYFKQTDRLLIHTPTEFAPTTADPQVRAIVRARAAPDAPGGACKVLAWGVHDLNAEVVVQLRDDIAETAGVPREQVRVLAIPHRKIGLFGKTKKRQEAFIFVRAS